MTTPVSTTHIIWDWNGTLLDDVDLIVASASHAFVEAGLSTVSVERYREQFAISSAELIRNLFGRMPPEAAVSAMNATYQDHYRASRATCGLTADALACLEGWKRNNGTQSLLSLHAHADLSEMVSEHGIAAYFEVVAGREGDAVDGKYGHLLRHLDVLEAQGIPRERVVMIGDTLDDALAARRAGVAAILYSGGVQTAVALKEAGVPVVDSLREALAAAGGTRLPA